MAALYSRELTAADLEGTGFTVEDYASDEVQELWPENARAINLFSTLSTQWRTSAGGPIGLDYNTMFFLMEKMSLGSVDHDQLFSDMRIIESEALLIMNKKQE